MPSKGQEDHFLTKFMNATAGGFLNVMAGNVRLVLVLRFCFSQNSNTVGTHDNVHMK